MRPDAGSSFDRVSFLFFLFLLFPMAVRASSAAHPTEPAVRPFCHSGRYSASCSPVVCGRTFLRRKAQMTSQWDRVLMLSRKMFLCFVFFFLRGRGGAFGDVPGAIAVGARLQRENERGFESAGRRAACGINRSIKAIAIERESAGQRAPNVGPR